MGRRQARQAWKTQTRWNPEMKHVAPITMATLIQVVRDRLDREKNYCVYGRGDSDAADLNSDCFLGDGPEITNNYEEIYPGFVIQNGLEFWCMDELVQDVVDNALHQNASVSDELILAAIKYYDNKDCFMQL